jgi:hypothetical protein
MPRSAVAHDISLRYMLRRMKFQSVSASLAI